MQRNLALFRIPNLGFQSGDSAFWVQMSAHIARAAQQSVIDFHEFCFKLVAIAHKIIELYFVVIAQTSTESQTLLGAYIARP